MPRLAALLLLPIFVVPALSGETPAPQISWHGQSFFTIKTGKGNIVAIDPHALPEYGKTIGLKADFCLVTHNHTDHTAVGVIENSKDKNFRVIPGLNGPSIKADWNPVDETVKDVRIRSV